MRRPALVRLHTDYALVGCQPAVVQEGPAEVIDCGVNRDRGRVEAVEQGLFEHGDARRVSGRVVGGEVRGRVGALGVVRRMIR